MCFFNCLFEHQLPFLSRNTHAQLFLSPLADSPTVLNRNHQSFSSNVESNTNNKAKTLQESAPSGSGKQPFPPTMLNGRNGSMKADSIDENSSSSFLGHSLGSKTPPVPGRAAQSNHTPVPLPRTSLSVVARSTSGGQRAQESPKLLRNIRAEATSSLTPPSRGSGQGTESPQIRGASLQKRSPSPMRDPQLSHADVPQRLRTPEATGSTRDPLPLSSYTTNRGTPGSQCLASSLTSQGLTSKSVPESPQGPRKLTAPSKTEAVRPPHAQNASSLSGLEKEAGARQLMTASGCTIRPSHSSLSGSPPLTSPNSQRKTPCATVTGASSKEQSLAKPYTRERKNSISEINDNEDELLEYHRWQREERLREQEMEKLVSDQHRRHDFTADLRIKVTSVKNKCSLDPNVVFRWEKPFFV